MSRSRKRREERREQKKDSMQTAWTQTDVELPADLVVEAEARARHT